MNRSFRTGNAALFRCSARINANVAKKGVLKDVPNVLESWRQFEDCSDPSSPSGSGNRFVDLIILKKRGQKYS